ncbi:MAG TPA: 1-phosphofructokinase family hexose kinase [Thermomicrobiales bacterium]|jgi:1-phosphofructokinase family hexose kinase|nr:1-phosphofructokinase family hexose kinase [Thermomicrobiales bacterium]
MTIATITLNASIDTTWSLPRFAVGAINRVERKEAVAGGKGNNVARVLATLGQPVVASGFVAGWAGRFIETEIAAAGIATAFQAISGESRTSLAIVETDNGRVTEAREPGPTVAAEDWERFLAATPSRLRGATTVALCGSLPPGLPDDAYAQLIRVLRNVGCRTALDTSGAALREGLAAGPDLVKPNAAELAELAGLAGPEVETATLLAAAREIARTRLGPEGRVLLSLGAGGAALIDRAETLLTSAPAVDVVSPVGCGDALLAGFLDAAARGESPAEALRWAVAVGAAAALQSRPGVVDPADVARLARREAA